MSIAPSANSDDGILWAYLLDGTGAGGPVDSTAKPPETLPGTFTWFHLESDNAQSVEWMHNRGLSENVIEALTEVDTRPRSMPLGDGALLVLRGVNTNPGANPSDMVSVRLWFDANMIVSARKRHRKLLSVIDIRDKIDNRIGPKSTSQFVTMLIERLADRIGDAVDNIDEDLTAFETSVGEDGMIEIRRKLSVARRQTAAIRRHLAPQREALDSLFRNRGALDEKDAYVIRQETERIIRYVEDLDLARERALVLQEELQSRIAEEQNARIYVLSIVAAIFLPLSFLTGVFGMNVAGLPGTANPAAFIYLSLSMAAIGIMLMAYMHWRRWL